jgi:repressor LexA
VNFGDQIKIFREDKGLSQEVAAKEIREKYNVRLSSAYLSMIERGERDNLTSKLENALRDYFGLSTMQRRGRINRIEAVESGSIPILGTIRAGLPILADENIEGYLDVPDSMQADFVLRVKGDSMTGAGILDGDLVICKKADAAQSGQIVVALQDQSAGFSDATLKYYYDANGHGAVLRPANPNYSEINMSDGYRIGGVMVALVREDAPGYQIYKNYIAVPEHEEWTEVIELANQAGLKVGQVKEILAGQVAIAKKLRG